MNNSYTYTVSNNQEVKIATPGNFSFSEIKKTAEQTADKIVSHSVYPNGFEIEFVQYAGLITVTTTLPLTPDGHGGYIAPTDK